VDYAQGSTPPEIQLAGVVADLTLRRNIHHVDFLTCCVINNKLEVCADCQDYPFKRFNSEKNGYDSFVTHKMVFVNLNYIKTNGIASLIDQQKISIEILKNLLANFDDGRSKSLYCITSALLPLDKLQEILRFANSLNTILEPKEKSRLTKEYCLKIAGSLNIDLKLNHKK